MMSRKTDRTAPHAIFALVEIKRIIAAFESGELNLFEALRTIAVAAASADEGPSSHRSAEAA